MADLRKEIEQMCICHRCPSWVECKELGAFCYPSVNKSKCITKQNGCICGSCPVTKKYKLERYYYCMNGSEKSWPNI